MTEALHASFVPGIPVAQGSKAVNRRTGQVFESNHGFRGWREAIAGVTHFCHRTGPTRQHAPAIDVPVTVELLFVLPRPARPRFEVPATKPDVDKLERAVLDGLQTGGVLREDSRVVRLTAEKIYGPAPGVHIRIYAHQPRALDTALADMATSGN